MAVTRGVELNAEAQRAPSGLRHAAGSTGGLRGSQSERCSAGTRLQSWDFRCIFSIEKITRDCKG